MKRWAVITVVLYLATLLLLTVPVGVACFVGWGHNPMTLREIIDGFREWGYWIWIGISLVAQVLLLLVPVALGERRPRSRRNLMVPVITAAFLFAVVCVSAVTALCCGILGDNQKLSALYGDTGNQILCTFVTYLVVTWTVWFFVFRRFADTANPEALTLRLMRWLLRGSILELLIAVPSHVFSRNRHDCCAPAGTFWGIATGITVMLLSFGPGVLFLFSARMRRLQPNQDKTNL